MSIPLIKQLVNSATDPFKQLRDLLEQEQALQEAIKKLQSDNEGLQEEIDELTDLQKELTMRLLALQSIGFPSAAQKKEIEKLKEQIKANKDTIAADKEQITNNKSQITQGQSTLKDIQTSLGTISNSGDIIDNFDEIAKNAAAQQFSEDVSLNADAVLEMRRRAAIDTVMSYAELTQTLAADAINCIDRIKTDRKTIDKCKARLEELEHDFFEDLLMGCGLALLTSVFSGAAGYYNLIKAAIDKADEKEVKSLLHHTEKDLKKAQAQLKSDLEQLALLKTSELKNLIEDLLKKVESI